MHLQKSADVVAEAGRRASSLADEVADAVKDGRPSELLEEMLASALLEMMRLEREKCAMIAEHRADLWESALDRYTQTGFADCPAFTNGCGTVSSAGQSDFAGSPELTRFRRTCWATSDSQSFPGSSVAATRRTRSASCCPKHARKDLITSSSPPTRATLHRSA